MANKKRPAAYTATVKEVGERIRWARELVQPNRAQFARDMGVDRSTVRNIENGKRTASIFNILEISHLLRVSPNYILQGKLQDVDGELAGKLAIRHPHLAGGAPSAGTPDRASSGNTSEKPRKRGRPAN